MAGSLVLPAIIRTLTFGRIFSRLSNINASILLHSLLYNLAFYSLIRTFANNLININMKTKICKFGAIGILMAQISLFVLCSCGTSSLSQRSSGTNIPIEQSNVSVIADKVWTFSQSHPNGFTLDVRTLSEPKEGIVVAYADTQNSHSRDQLDKVIRHALQHDGYIGGWFNADDSLFYFDSSRIFPEKSLKKAIKHGKKNGQLAIFILSSQTVIPLEVK